jgi:protein phosphatase
MRVVVGFATDIGRIREGNEDSYLIEPPLYAVADGMGGARGGEVASHLALDTIEELHLAHKGTLAEQVRQANRVVFARSSTDRTVAGMGTTLTAATVDGDAVHLVHVGDSRAYLLRAGALRQLTDDHTLVNRMLKAGEISSEEAAQHPHRNVLTRVVGTDPEVQVDEDDVGLLDGDRLLLCSDGLTDMLTESQIRAILETTPEPQEAADRLVRAANRAGGIDNITVIVIDAHGAGGAGGGARPWPDRPRRIAWIRRGAVTIVLVAAALVGVRAFLDAQWYVGVAEDRVAIYRGIPAEVLGLDLSEPQVVTDIDAAAAAAHPFYGSLPEGITVTDRAAAERVVEEIRATLDAAEAQDDGAGGAGDGTQDGAQQDDAGGGTR